jgi:pSer/pThr/pTyr-binding forkhead associated (FHA) protein
MEQSETKDVKDVAALRIVDGSEVGRVYALDKPIMFIGRHADCDIVLPSIVVSRRHVQLSFEDDNWYARDTGTGGGTKINGRQIAGRTLLKEGDRIQVCMFVLAFVGDVSKGIADGERIQKVVPTDGVDS